MRTLFHVAAAAIQISVHQPAIGQLTTEATTPAPGDNVVVRAIHQDNQGHYWFGTWADGVYRFDGRAFERLTTAEGLANNQVRSILSDHTERVWFETANGISHWDGNRLAIVGERDFLSTDTWQLEPGDLWFKGDEEFGYNNRERRPGVYRYDGETLRYHAFPIDAPPARHGSYSVTGIDQHKPGRVWIATYSAVLGFDGQDITVIDDKALGHTEDTGYLHARCVFEDSTGRLWIGNNGIGVIMRDGDETTNFTQAQGVGRRDRRSGSDRTTPIPGDAPAGEPTLHRVFAIGEDALGNIWFGTVEQGAWRCDGAALRQFTDRDGLDTPQVVAIYTDRDGNLILGGKGVFRFDGEQFERLY